MQAQVEKLLRDTQRDGIEDVITFLAKSDFYISPASSGLTYHNCMEGGLVDHSWKTYKMMVSLNDMLSEDQKFNKDSIVLVGLLHDLCKANTYNVNILKSGSQSEKIPYKRNDQFPAGHGEKSVIQLLQLGLDLTNEEILGIRWHMNAFDDIGSYKAASNWNKLSIMCFLGDYFSSTFLEFKKNKKEE